MSDRKTVVLDQEAVVPEVKPIVSDQEPAVPVRKSFLQVIFEFLACLFKQDCL